MLKVIAMLILITNQLHLSVPAPEIIATPIPYLAERNSEDFLNPASKRGAGHRGIDLIDMAGEKIHAPFAGEVTFVGKVFNREVITLRGDSGLLASFEPVCSDLRRGERVSAGEEIGSWCQPSEGYHEHCLACVHFSIRSARGYLNPLLFFGRVRPSVLVA